MKGSEASSQVEIDSSDFSEALSDEALDRELSEAFGCYCKCSLVNN